MFLQQAKSRRAFAGYAAATAAALTTGIPAMASSTPEASAVVTGKLTIYSGRSESLVAPIIEKMVQDTGLDIEVRYGSTAELAAQILEEGDNSPAGLYFAQDAGALGALAKHDRLTKLADDILAMVDPTLSDNDGRWVGVSGRARVVVFQPDLVDETAVPESILDLPTASIGSIGYAPTNASFQTFVTALRLTQGEDGAREWLEALQAADSVVFEGNGPIVDAVGNGEIALGLVNHYYLYEKLAENPKLTAKNHYYLNGDIGGMVNVAGAGILSSGTQQAQAEVAVRYLLGETAQHYFAETTAEYPLAAGVAPTEELPPLADYQLPDVNLNDLDDLEGTLALLTELGMI